MNKKGTYVDTVVFQVTGGVKMTRSGTPVLIVPDECSTNTNVMKSIVSPAKHADYSNGETCLYYF